MGAFEMLLPTSRVIEQRLSTHIHSVHNRAIQCRRQVGAWCMRRYPRNQPVWQATEIRHYDRQGQGNIDTVGIRVRDRVGA